MTRKNYPVIGRVLKRPQNTAATCKCGKVGKYITEIQFNYMRGDDGCEWACEGHKNDLEFLLGGK